ncbi:hypothetical protein FHS45_002344 [Thalassobacillus devorans]|uniref:nuclease-related domain-containing protein n=1 Tax=Thalassobacillus devorans TaxID=279813 RepID=UPI0007840658|nr:nuclease-related domain-containing protein [Thalassobacillus devorans]NIK29243.1 hypothetical protein [Thalassobacillus devorans]
MLVKKRSEPSEIKVLEELDLRMGLAEKHRKYLFNLKKGFVGESRFDHLLEELHMECYILNDLLLQTNNTTFQIDTLMVTANKIYLYEIKNFEGDYYYESDKLFKFPENEILNPIHQLQRTETLLRQLLQQHGSPFPIESFVVFINPNFTLYKAPVDKPILYFSQLKKYLHTLESTSSPMEKRHSSLVKKLQVLQINNSPFHQLPAYHFQDLRKGFHCAQCLSFSTIIVDRTCICNACGHRERSADTLLRTIQAFQLLFPEEKLTTSRIYQWFGGIVTNRRIQRSLAKNFVTVGNGKWTYYI